MHDPLSITVTEVNVCGLKEKNISVRNENNEVIPLKEDSDFDYSEREDPYGWKICTYRIKKSVFLNEGQYTVILSSVDLAGNHNTNSSKGRNIRFVIDQTKPSGLILGLEEKHYIEKEHPIYIRADDNFGLKEAVLFINGRVQKTYSEKDFADGLGAEEILSESHKIQKVSLQLTDWAGNSRIVLPDGNSAGSLICKDRMIHFLHNKILLLTALLLLAVFVVIYIGVWGRKYVIRKGKPAL